MLHYDELTDIIIDQGYCMDLIFNMDETGLNNKMLPSRLWLQKLIERLM